jgi:uncharacterized membrane-anchored protein
MKNDESRRGARGWLVKDHIYRRRIVDEIQKRADYPIRPRARVTRLMMAGETATDFFRRKLLERVEESSPQTEDDVREKLRELIISLAPSHTQTELAQQFASLADAISTVTRAIPPVQSRFRKDSRKAFDILASAFEDGQPFHRARNACDDGRDPEFDEMPFQNGGARGKIWLDLTPGLGSAHSEGRRLRLYRESYPSNETLNVWEDFETATAAQNNAFLSEQAGEVCINVANAGIDAFDGLLREFPDSLGQYQWVGSLLSVSHFWIIPAGEALCDIEDGELEEAQSALRENPKSKVKAVQNVLKSAARFAARSFEHKDPTSDGRTRSDHVLTLIGDGDAILIADFQAYSRDADLKERAIRYAIINLGASEDKLGRILMRLNDIEAYRIVALRDYQFTFPVTNVIDACNAHIAFAENNAARRNSMKQTTNERRKSMIELLGNVSDISARITAANHFIEGGLVGLADRAKEMQGLIHTRLRDLNERPVLGYQSLSGYIRKADNAVNSMQRSKSRYIRARDRIDEIVNLARGEIDQINSSENNNMTKALLVITGIVVAVDFMTILVTLFNPGGRTIFSQAVAYICMAGLSASVGVLTGKVVEWWLGRNR